MILESKLKLDIMYDRTTSQQIYKWILHRDKDINNIISIILTYAFIDYEYRMGKKGSSIICLVEEVEKILGWGIPT